MPSLFLEPWVCSCSSTGYVTVLHLLLPVNVFYSVWEAYSPLTPCKLREKGTQSLTTYAGEIPKDIPYFWGFWGFFFLFSFKKFFLTIFLLKRRLHLLGLRYWFYHSFCHNSIFLIHTKTPLIFINWWHFFFLSLEVLFGKRRMEASSE